MFLSLYFAYLQHSIEQSAYPPAPVILSLIRLVVKTSGDLCCGR